MYAPLACELPLKSEPSAPVYTSHCWESGVAAPVTLSAKAITEAEVTLKVRVMRPLVMASPPARALGKVAGAPAALAVGVRKKAEKPAAGSAPWKHSHCTARPPGEGGPLLLLLYSARSARSRADRGSSCAVTGAPAASATA